MEPFVDFGFLEIVAATGLGWIAKRIYTSRVVAIMFLLASLIAPATLIVVISDGSARWIAALCLATSILNVTVLLPLVRDRSLPELLARENVRQL